MQAFFVLSGFLLTPILINMRLSCRREGTPALLWPPKPQDLSAVLRLPRRDQRGGRACARTRGRPSASGPAVGGASAFQRASGVRATYTYNFFHASRDFTHTPLLTHFWSLAVEEQFYLVWPFLLFLVPNARLKGVLLALIDRRSNREACRSGSRFRRDARTVFQAPRPGALCAAVLTHRCLRHRRLPGAVTDAHHRAAWWQDTQRCW